MDKSPATPDDYDLRTVMDDSESWTEGSTDLEMALEPHTQKIEECGLARPPLPTGGCRQASRLGGSGSAKPVANSKRNPSGADVDAVVVAGDSLNTGDTLSLFGWW